MPVRAAIYARLSDDRDADKLGIDNQLGDARALAASRGWVVADEYIDRGISASSKTAKRSRYDEMVRDFGLGLFDALVVWDLDRLTRQPRQLEDWIDAAEERGLLVVTANGEADLSTDAGRLFARIKVSVGKAEAEATSRRIKRNIAARQAAGRWHGGSVPFGYRTRVNLSEDGRPLGTVLEVEPAEAAMLKEAAKRLLAGDTMYSIVSDWNQDGRSTDRVAEQTVHGKTMRKGRHWRQTTLRSMLTNRVLLGEVKGGDGTAVWPPVFDRETFDAVSEMFTEPSRRTPNPEGVKSTKYTMAGGLTVCGRCGKRLVTQRHRGRARLVCSKAANGMDACGRIMIDHDRLEEYTRAWLMAKLEADPDWVKGRSAPAVAADKKALAALHDRRADLQRQEERIATEYVTGRIKSSILDKESARVASELEVVERELAAMYGATRQHAAKSEPIRWDKWSPARRRAFISTFIDHVRVNPYPEKTATGIPPRKGEAPEVTAARREAHYVEVMKQRVEFDY